jgi:hypothetical protein
MTGGREKERKFRKMFYKINEKEKLQFQAHQGLNELITKQISVHYHNFVAPRKRVCLMNFDNFGGEDERKLEAKIYRRK